MRCGDPVVRADASSPPREVAQIERDKAVADGKEGGEITKTDTGASKRKSTEDGGAAKKAKTESTPDDDDEEDE